MTTPTDRDDGGSTVDAEERRNAWQAIEPDLRPFVDKTERPWSWRHDALERRRAACWRQWLAEPPTPLDGAALLAQTEARLHTFCRASSPGENHLSAEAGPWPMTDAQREAIRDGAERLRAVAEILAVSPYFSWYASRDALEKQRVQDEASGFYFSERFYRAFNRPDLAPGTYCKLNVGWTGPRENEEVAGEWPKATCLDAIGWTALLWGHSRNDWRWGDSGSRYGYFKFDDPSCESRSFKDLKDNPASIRVGGGVGGVSYFVSLAEIDGQRLNAAATRLLERRNDELQWLGASADEVGPYWDTHVSGRDMAEVCRAFVNGEDARDAWYAKAIPRLELQGAWPSDGEERTDPRLPERLSTLIATAVTAGRRLDPARYHPASHRLHRWSARRGRCELDLAGMLLNELHRLPPDAEPDTVWRHALESYRTMETL